MTRLHLWYLFLNLISQTKNSTSKPLSFTWRVTGLCEFPANRHASMDIEFWIKHNTIALNLYFSSLHIRWIPPAPCYSQRHNLSTFRILFSTGITIFFCMVENEFDAAPIIIIIKIVWAPSCRAAEHRYTSSFKTFSSNFRSRPVVKGEKSIWENKCPRTNTNIETTHGAQRGGLFPPFSQTNAKNKINKCCRKQTKVFAILFFFLAVSDLFLLLLLRWLTVSICLIPVEWMEDDVCLFDSVASRNDANTNTPTTEQASQFCRRKRNGKRNRELTI